MIGELVTHHHKYEGQLGIVIGVTYHHVFLDRIERCTVKWSRGRTIKYGSRDGDWIQTEDHKLLNLRIVTHDNWRSHESR